jgi:hypothetical protein
MVRDNVPDFDLEVCLAHPAIDPYPGAALGDTIVDQIVEAVVLTKGDAGENPIAELLLHLVPRHRSMSAQGNDHLDLLLVHPGFNQLLQQNGKNQAGGSWAGVVIDNDHHPGIAFNQSGKCSTTDGLPNRSSHLIPLICYTPNRPGTQLETEVVPWNIDSYDLWAIVNLQCILLLYVFSELP